MLSKNILERKKR